MLLERVRILSLLCMLSSSAPALAQSLDVKHPAALQAGLNTATCDSMVGPQFWYFYAEPGSFSGVITRRNSPGDTIRAKLGAGISFAPKLAYSVITSADKGEQTTFAGSAKTRDKVMVMIDPGRAGLVRSACNYEIQVSGNVSFAEVSSVPAITGTYMSQSDQYGLTKFKEDGSIVCADGKSGKWTLFDQDTATYVVEFPETHTRLNLHLVPGRGLVEATNYGMIAFKQLH